MLSTWKGLVNPEPVVGTTGLETSLDVRFLLLLRGVPKLLPSLQFFFLLQVSQEVNGNEDEKHSSDQSHHTDHERDLGQCLRSPHLTLLKQALRSDGQNQGDEGHWEVEEHANKDGEKHVTLMFVVLDFERLFGGMLTDDHVAVHEVHFEVLPSERFVALSRAGMFGSLWGFP